MNKIEKFLRSLSPEEKHAMLLLLRQIEQDPFKIPGMIALKGLKGFYRVRMGRYRIVFFFDPRTNIADIRYIGRRNESTYKNFR